MGAKCSQLRRKTRRKATSQASIYANSCGLITQTGQQVPLKSVEVEVQVKGHVATVTSTLQYVNKEKLPLEALFVFPLPAEAALCHFSAKIANQEVVAEVQEKQKAREDYDDAISSGQQAFLLEESDASPDIFRLAVGNLPPKENAAVTLIYVIELAVQADDGLRFCLPAVLNPRYAPSNIDASNVPEVTAVPAIKVSYTLSLSVHIISPIPVSKVESSCSLEPLIYLNTAQTQAKVSLSPGHKFDRDVEMLLYYQDAHQPTAIVEAGLPNAKPGSLMGDSVVMVSLYPEFPPEVAYTFGKRGEFIFLMDQSGSMSGSSIKSARETLLLLLKSLPLGCYFNIYGFGSDFKSFFYKSVEYTQQTMEEAMKKVEAMNADMGGTEILKPLRHIYGQECLPDHPRQVFVFTDGEVFNTKEILDLVRTHSRSHRCFTFGIGQGASTALITGMATEGRGIAQFITSDDRLQLKVMQSLSLALQPSVVDISVQWTLPEGVSVTALSPPLNVILQGQRALLYAQVTGESSENDEGSVTVHYGLAEQPMTNQLSFCLKPSGDTGLGIHRLAARSLIRSLEMEQREKKDESLREKVVELSVQAGVSSAFTAFLAVHKGSGQPVRGPLVRRTVPVAQACGGGFQMARRGSQTEPWRGALPPDEWASLAGSDYETGLGPTEDDYPDYICCGSDSPPGGKYQDVLGESPPEDGYCDGILFPSKFPPGGKYQDVLGESPPEDDFCDGLLFPSKYPPVPPAQKDPYLELLSLQKAAGFWELETRLLDLFGKAEQNLDKQMPAQVDSAVWATVLALIWLHGFSADKQEEWKFIALKATSWIRSQKVGNLSECVQAGNALLGCQVKEESLGL
ncbi:von Willebrand factor A domain-containing protein 5A-like [Colossoma macropomum]|uniref:von Willebrand factor A domain-containing protein 5A-like n=1 Tax=Colossoma macropomum TaxID=42526 RepID=UPI0018653243|nr:von Willebrand factor A domain-containing protein 5A-like [Colossoma macropomum]